MKLEIDISDPESLRRQEKELSAYLSVVRKALEFCSGQSAHSQAGHEQENHPLLDKLAKARVMSGVDEEELGETINDLPGEFSTTEAIDKAASKGVSGSSLRACLALLVENGELEIISKGQGRRPTTFRKVIKPKETA